MSPIHSLTVSMIMKSLLQVHAKWSKSNPACSWPYIKTTLFCKQFNFANFVRTFLIQKIGYLLNGWYYISWIHLYFGMVKFSSSQKYRLSANHKIKYPQNLSFLLNYLQASCPCISAKILTPLGRAEEWTDRIFSLDTCSTKMLCVYCGGWRKSGGRAAGRSVGRFLFLVSERERGRDGQTAPGMFASLTWSECLPRGWWGLPFLLESKVSLVVMAERVSFRWRIL